MGYRERQNGYLNCEKRIFPGVGPFEFPEIKPVHVDLTDAEVIGFNYATGCKHPENKVCHFYLDDYRFERVWINPNRYVPILRRFKAVLAPDFSMYVDFPKAVQIFNNYRKQWCAAYWQENGITVIPTICWSTPDSFEWCFDGVPKHSLICISTVGGFGVRSDKEAWLAGYEKCLEVLEPSEILLFGKQHPEIRPYGKTIVVPCSNLERKSTLSSKHVPPGVDTTLIYENTNNFIEGSNTAWVEEDPEVD